MTSCIEKIQRIMACEQRRKGIQRRRLRVNEFGDPIRVPTFRALML